MAMNKPPNFDRVARIYRWAEYASLGTLLETMREHFLPQLHDVRKALVLGDGDGRFTAKLLDRNSHVQVQAVDLSAKMLALLEQRAVDHRDRLTVTQGNVLKIDLPKDADLVVTNFFLDCLTQMQLEQVVGMLGRDAPHGTIWVVSDFAVPRGWMAHPARMYIRALYFAFRLLTGLRVQHLPDPQSALTHAGFLSIDRYARLGGLLYTELWRRE